MRKNIPDVLSVYVKLSVSLLILTLLGAVCSTLMFLTARPLSALLLTTSSEDALSEAVHYLHVVSIFYIFCFAGNTFAGYFDGIGKVQIPFIGAASHISIRILFSFLLIRYLHMDLTAVALATGIGWIWANFFWAICRSVISAKHQCPENHRRETPAASGSNLQSIWVP